MDNPTTNPKKQPQREKALLVSVKKFQYIGDISYTFKDAHGYTYIAQPNQILFVPDDSLARHFKAKKLYFKEL